MKARLTMAQQHPCPYECKAMCADSWFGGAASPAIPQSHNEETLRAVGPILFEKLCLACVEGKAKLSEEGAAATFRAVVWVQFSSRGENFLAQKHFA